MVRNQGPSMADFLKKQHAARPQGIPFFERSAWEKIAIQNAQVEKANRLAFMPDDEEAGKKKAPHARGKKKPFTGVPGKQVKDGTSKRRDVVPVKDYVEATKAPRKSGTKAEQLAAALQREQDDRADSKSPIGIEGNDNENQNEEETQIDDSEDQPEDEENEENEEDVPAQGSITRGMEAEEEKQVEMAIAASLEDQTLDSMMSFFFNNAMPEEQAIDTGINNVIKVTGDTEVNKITDDTDVTKVTGDTIVSNIPDDTLDDVDDTLVNAWPRYGDNEKTATTPTRFLGLARLPADLVDEFKARLSKQIEVGRDARCQFTSESVNDSEPELEDIGIEFWDTVKDAKRAKYSMGGMFVGGKKLQVVFAIEE